MGEQITIVAGGWSVRDLDLAALPGTVIGVNDAAIKLGRCDYAVSMDRLWTENRAEILRERRMRAYIRRSALKKVEPWPGMESFECDYQIGVMSKEYGTLNGGNSGICALNLAFQMQPDRIFLCGFDMTRGPAGESYWYPNYSWAPGGATSNGRYGEWAKQFDVAAKDFAAAGIEVLNVSAAGPLTAFRRITGEEMKAFC